MRRYGFLFLILFISSCTLNKKKSYSVPFELGEKSRILVKGEVFSSTYEFLLDSGARSVWMNSKILAHLPHEKVPTQSQSLIGTAFDFETSEVEEIVVNNIPFKNIQIHSSNTQSSPLMPLTLFEAKIITFNFDKKIIHFNTEESFCTPETRFAINHNKQILIPIKYLNEILWFVFDTGADRGIIKSSAQKIFVRDFIITNKTTITSPYLAEQFSAPLVRLNNTTFLNHKIEQEFAVVDLKVHYLVANSFTGLVGLDFITKYNWHFDFPQMKFCAIKRN